MALALGGCRESGIERSSATWNARQLCIEVRLEECTLAYATVADRDPIGRGGDEARVGLASVLVRERRDADAVARLQPVVERGQVAPEYSALLLGEAVVSGGLRDTAEWARDRLESIAFASSSANVRERARLVAAKLLVLQGAYSEAADAAREVVRLFPRSSRSREAQWVAAEALRLSGNRDMATVEYARLWYSGPGREWGVEAQARLEEAGVWPSRSSRPPAGTSYFEYLRELQAAGLHEVALAELGQAEAAGKPAERLALSVVSLHATRRNSECQKAALDLRARFPTSPDLPTVALTAIRCLRRLEQEGQILEWWNWMNSRLPGRVESVRAAYEVGSFLINADRVREGVDTLEGVVRGGADSGLLDDALWRICWAKRRAADTPGAIDALERLLEVCPRTGFRKAAVYWVSRFNEPFDRRRAIEGYRQLLREFPHDYYGHEARRNLEALGELGNLLGSSMPFPSVDPLTESIRFPSDESYVRAVALSRLGLFEYAAEELEALASKYSDLRFTQSLLLSYAGRPAAAVEQCLRHFPSFAQSGSRNSAIVPREFWRVLYPYRYRTEIKAAVTSAGLEGSNIDEDLVAAVILMESSFEPRARSPVGAVGLMQLMPATASRVAVMAGLPAPEQADLFHPGLNVRLGALYLAQLVRESDGDWFRAVCSFNAGPGAVKGWKRAGARDEFIESIPFVDTRLYLKKVLGNYWNYQWIYRGPEDG